MNKASLATKTAFYLSQIPKLYLISPVNRDHPSLTRHGCSLLHGMNMTGWAANSLLAALNKVN